MRLIADEAKKLFMKNHLLLLAIVLLVLSVVFSATAKPIETFTDSANAAAYLEYNLFLQGRVTPEKKEFLNQKRADIENAKSVLENEQKEYDEGKITAEKYLSLTEKEKTLIGLEPALLICESQMRYAEKDSDRHYLGDFLGWQVLLNNSGINWFILIFALAFSVLCVTSETRNEMDVLQFTSKRGRHGTYLSKVVLALITVGVFSAVIFLLKFLFISEQYDMTFASRYPIQSLTEYETLNKNISFFESYLLISFAKIFGYCCLTVLTMCITKWLKKVTLSLTVVLGMICIPIYLFPQQPDGQLIYYLPLPIGPILAEGYFKGTKELVDGGYAFKELPFTAIFVTLGFLLAVTAVMIVSFAMPKHTKKIKIRTLSFVICLPVFLAGCAAQSGEKIADSQVDTFVTLDEQYYFSVEQKEIFSINPTPLSNYELIYIDGDSAYVREAVSMQAGQYLVRRLNLHSFKDEVIYRQGALADIDGFLGLDVLFPELEKIGGDIELQNLSMECHYVANTLLFVTERYVLAIDTKSRAREKLLEAFRPHDIQFDGADVYFLDDINRLQKYDLITKTIKTIDAHNINSYFVFEGVVYTQPASPAKEISGNGQAFNLKSAFTDFWVSNDAIFTAGDRNIYIYIGNAELTIPIPDYSRYIFSDSNYVYFYKYSEKGSSVFWTDYKGLIKGQCYADGISSEQ